MHAAAAISRRLSPREWALVALGVLAWVAIGLGGAWFVHQLTLEKQACAAAAADDAPTHQVKSSKKGPNNAFQAITGQRTCQ